MSDVPLSHVMQAYFTSAPDLSRPDPYLNMEFAYGNPTPAKILAAGGNAVYARELHRILQDVTSSRVQTG